MSIGIERDDYRQSYEPLSPEITSGTSYCVILSTDLHLFCEMLWLSVLFRDLPRWTFQVFMHPNLDASLGTVIPRCVQRELLEPLTKFPGLHHFSITGIPDTKYKADVIARGTENPPNVQCILDKLVALKNEGDDAYHASHFRLTVSRYREALKLSKTSIYYLHTASGEMMTQKSITIFHLTANLATAHLMLSDWVVAEFWIRQAIKAYRYIPHRPPYTGRTSPLAGDSDLGAPLAAAWRRSEKRGAVRFLWQLDAYIGHPSELLSALREYVVEFEDVAMGVAEIVAESQRIKDSTDTEYLQDAGFA